MESYPSDKPHLEFDFSTSVIGEAGHDRVLIVLSLGESGTGDDIGAVDDSGAVVFS